MTDDLTRLRVRILEMSEEAERLPSPEYETTLKILYKAHRAVREQNVFLARHLTYWARQILDGEASV